MVARALVEDYKARLHPTTYGQLARRCDLEPGRWFGQVTDLIDAACALAGVPSFALVRVCEASGNVNEEAWRKEYSHLRDRIIATALAGEWTEEDFTKIRDALAVFSAHAFGNKKAWAYVFAYLVKSTWRTGGRLRDHTLLSVDVINRYGPIPRPVRSGIPAEPTQGMHPKPAPRADRRGGPIDDTDSAKKAVIDDAVSPIRSRSMTSGHRSHRA
jgi:hypothetical protein